MTERFRDAGTTIYEFGVVFLVRCPRCSRRASVIRAASATDDYSYSFRRVFDVPRRCVCTYCGYIRDWEIGSVRIGGPRDWYFGLPLWLQTPCCGHTLWAYN